MHDRRMTPVEIYRDGRYGMREGAWSEVLSWGELEEGTARWNEAYAVARDTMQRARQNVETIIAYLRAESYVFGPAPGSDLSPEPTWQPPTPESEAQLMRLQTEYGPLPLSLRAWYEIVGAVSLRGRFPEGPDYDEWLPMNDPLMVDPLDWILEELDGERRWLEEHPERAAEENLQRSDPAKWLITIAPDVYHKAHVSGGAPYQIRVPDRRADAPVLNVSVFVATPPGAPAPRQQMWLDEMFVSYLRRAFQWAGFPGSAFESWPGEERLQPLFAQMLPI
jgi:hypothetical protein